MKITVVVLVLSVSAVHAESITYSSAFNNILPVPALPGFDPSLGTLTETHVDVTGTVDGFWFTDGTLVESGTSHLFFEARLDGNHVAGFSGDAPFTVPPCTGFEWLGTFDAAGTITDATNQPINLAFSCTVRLDSTAPLTTIRTSVVGVESITYAYAAVPEPQSLILLGISMVAVVSVGFGTRSIPGR